MNVHDLLTQEHIQLRQRVQELRAAMADHVDKLPELLSALQNDVRVHFRKEDDAYYPTVDADKRLPDRALLHTLRNDHAAVIFSLESLAIRLRKKVPMSEWKAKFETMISVLLTHFDNEEQHLFPQAEKTLTPAEFEGILKTIQDQE